MPWAFLSFPSHPTPHLHLGWVRFSNPHFGIIQFTELVSIKECLILKTLLLTHHPVLVFPVDLLPTLDRGLTPWHPFQDGSQSVLVCSYHFWGVSLSAVSLRRRCLQCSMARMKIHFYLAYYLVHPCRVRGHPPPPYPLDLRSSTLPHCHLFCGTFPTTLSVLHGFVVKS